MLLRNYKYWTKYRDKTQSRITLRRQTRCEWTTSKPTKEENYTFCKNCTNSNSWKSKSSKNKCANAKGRSKWSLSYNKRRKCCWKDWVFRRSSGLSASRNMRRPGKSISLSMRLQGGSIEGIVVVIRAELPKIMKERRTFLFLDEVLRGGTNNCMIIIFFLFQRVLEAFFYWFNQRKIQKYTIHHQVLTHQPPHLMTWAEWPRQ